MRSLFDSDLPPGFRYQREFITTTDEASLVRGIATSLSGPSRCEASLPDAPQHEDVAGLSLLSACRMKFRPYLPPAGRRSPGLPKRRATHEIGLEPRSAYLMTGESRQGFEHHIPAVTSLRYSVTFRTLRR